MIAWKTTSHPKWKQLIFQQRVARAQLGYFDHFGFRKGRFKFPRPTLIKGYQSQIAALRNKYLDQPCTVICNGPSLESVPPETIKRTITIGCNGVYKKFPDWGFSTNFLVFEDVEQFEIRAPDLLAVNGPIKMAAIYNAYALSNTRDWIFFNAPRCANNDYYWSSEDIYPQFSKDFASVVHLGSTVTYIMLQLAFHLGCNPVYIVGLDHNYGKLPSLFPPGKIKITEENFDLVKHCHFDPSYYKIGDVIGVPWVKQQELAYDLALRSFTESGRSLLNVSDTTKLKVIPRIGVAKWSDHVKANVKCS